MHLQDNTYFDFVTQNVAQYRLHHMTYAATKFEVAVSNSLGGDTFIRNVEDDGSTLVPLKLVLQVPFHKDIHINFHFKLQKAFYSLSASVVC